MFWVTNHKHPNSSNLDLDEKKNIDFDVYKNSFFEIENVFLHREGLFCGLLDNRPQLCFESPTSTPTAVIFILMQDKQNLMFIKMFFWNLNLFLSDHK